MGGSMEPCEACNIGKLNQNNVINNSDNEPAKGKNEWTFPNISSVKGKKDGPLVQ